MNKNIYYIDLYNKEYKEKNIGFIRFNSKTMYIFLRMIRNIAQIKEIQVITNKEKYRINKDNIVIKQNITNQLALECNLPFEQIIINEVIILLDSSKEARCFVSLEGNKTYQISKSAYVDETIIPSYETDKWNQLYQTYQQIHIYPEAETIIINPKDMVVLTRQYHELATNSFVLHSYYNYRQLLLIKYKKQKECLYFIGAPGIYNEREKRIARMFGFEGFENGEKRLQEEEERKVYEGCFGYYMKKVDI